MSRKIHLKGYRIGKGGKVERDLRQLDVSKRLQQQAKRVRVAKRTSPR